MNHLVIAVKTTHGGLWILPQIRAARRRGIDVTVITPLGDGRLVRAVSELAEADSGVAHRAAPVDFSPRRPLQTVRGLWRLRQLIRGIAPDAVLYHLYATALAFRLATIGLTTKKIYMVAGPLYLDSGLIRLSERFLARLDDLVICGSKHIYDRYLALGLPRAHLAMIPYGVDTARFAPGTETDRHRSRGELGLDRNAFVVVMVAFVYAPKSLVHRGEGIKGHRHLLEAWASFRDMHSDAALLLVGGGFDVAGEAYRQHLIKRVAEGSGRLGDMNITWLTSVEDVRSAYVAADVSVSPSLSDNHGAALEASSMGTPCVVSDAGALPEAVTPDSGWIFPAGSVDGLSASLELAYQEWGSGALQARKQQARDLMMKQFEVGTLAQAVLDCIYG